MSLSMSRVSSLAFLVPLLLGAHGIRTSPLAAEDAEWAFLPHGFTVGRARLRIEIGGRPLDLELPEEWEPGSRTLSLELESGVRIDFRKAAPGLAGVESLEEVVLLFAAPEDRGPCDLWIEARVPRFASDRPARFVSKSPIDVGFLALDGAECDGARAWYDAAEDRGLDLYGTSDILRVESGLELDRAGAKESEAADGRWIRVSGRVPRGRETVVFSLAMRTPILSRVAESPRTESRIGPRSKGADGVAHPPSRASESWRIDAGALSGWILPGGGAVVDRAGRLLERQPHLGQGYLELGDGWQGKSGSRLFKGPARNWREPTGLSGPLSNALESLEGLGFRPGLWIVPFGSTRETDFDARPKAFLRDEKGTPIGDSFLGDHVLDPTAPEGLEYLRELFLALRSSGVRVFRLGGLAEARDAWRREGGSLLVRDRDPALIFRDALRAMRAAAGPEAILLADWRTPEEFAPALDGGWTEARAEDGYDPLWRLGMASARGYYRHRSPSWVECEPLVDYPQGGDAAEAIAAFESRLLGASVSGRGLLVDAALALPAEAAALLRERRLPSAIRPVDLFPRLAPPGLQVLELGSRGIGGSLVAAIRWSPWGAATSSAGREDLGLRPSPAGYVWFDVREGRIVGAGTHGIDCLLLARRSRLLAVREFLDRPQVLAWGTTIESNAEDISEIRWDPSERELRGFLGFPPISAVASGLGSASRAAESSVVLHVATPPPYEPTSVRVDGTPHAHEFVRGHLSVAVEPRASGGRVPFAIRFAVRPPATASPSTSASSPSTPMDLRIEPRHAERRPLLSWSGGELEWWLGVQGFAILRDGVEIARTRDTSFLDLGAGFEREHRYEVRVLPSGGSARTSFRMPPAEDQSIEPWSALDFTPASPPPERGRSAVGGLLSVGGVRFERGLGVRAPSRIDYALDGLWERFEASVGVDDAARFQGSVVFSIRLDGVEVLRTEVLRGGGGDPRAVRVPTRGARLLSLLVEDAGDGPDGDLADWGDPRMIAAPCAPVAARSHSHNDYLRGRPLLDALDRGFTSVEADIFLVDGALLVAHEREGIAAGRTLETLYLEPLLERTRRHGGRVYPELPVFQLLVDIKEDGEKVYPVLREVLSRYREMLSVFRGERVEEKGVAVILSGDSPRALLAAEKERLAAIDGRLVDLGLTPSPPVSLVPLVSQAWGSVFAWRGPFAMPAEERRRLRELVETAHAEGRKIRFWGSLDLPIVWKELLDAGVDYVNVDDLDGLAKYLAAREAIQPPAAASR